jgi:NADPH:quinone reductase-like Zn-dependent oxidoreductase
MAQSIASIKMDGVISIIGFLGGPNKTGDEPGFLQCLNNLCTVRGILVGSRVQFEDMNRAIEANVEKLRPIVDKEVFTLEKAKEAYEYMWAQKHFSKVCIKCE